ncbi:MAG: NAD-dependent deacetylase [Peptococcaceae bacterium]|nr:NAD-dependent deacetylase [Peptococcaceae bacterium]
MDYTEKINRLANLIKDSSCTLALTGAGISTESGIPDFRSPGGLWTKTNPMETASVFALKQDPAAFYKTNLMSWTGFTEKEPNPAHYALAKLEEKGLLTGVITQNIDGLHRKAGSKQLWEVHGHLRTCSCMYCKKRYPIDFLVNQFNEGINPPLCEACSGVLRLDVVLFGDDLGGDFGGAVLAMHRCSLLLVVGSSLTVYPVAELPDMAPQLAIVNKESTAWDNKAEVVVNDTAGRVLTDVLTALGK